MVGALHARCFRMRVGASRNSRVMRGRLGGDHHEGGVRSNAAMLEGTLRLGDDSSSARRCPNGIPDTRGDRAHSTR
jgi:hypothetical protein